MHVEFVGIGETQIW